MLINRPVWPSKNSVHFVHNWRCAGSTVNSILSSNYHNNYLKIGHPFTNFGWPHDYNNHPTPILSLAQIRDLMRISNPQQVIVGGHTFLGLESFLPAPFDIWMNYRDPLLRLNSGILRFYNKQFSYDSSQSHLIDTRQSLASTKLPMPLFVDRLLSTTLLRESNGLARRLASLSLSKDFNINDNSNVETVDCLTAQFSDQELFECSLSNLNRVKLLINSSHIQASLICIERIYNLKSPLINPFSNLFHNPVTISGAKANDTSVIDSCKDVLLKHSRVDNKLLPFLNKAFAKQVNSAKIDKRDIEVRNAIHHQHLFAQKWFRDSTFDRNHVVNLVAKSLEQRCQQFKFIDSDILQTVFNWQCLTLDFRSDINKVLVDRYSRSVYV